MKDAPYDVDLGAMWKDLGVERTGDTVRFVDSAPLAKTREAITNGNASAASSGTPSATQVTPVFVGWRSTSAK
jgi:hypothetical protein